MNTLIKRTISCTFVHNLIIKRHSRLRTFQQAMWRLCSIPQINTAGIHRINHNETRGQSSQHHDDHHMWSCTTGTWWFLITSMELCFFVWFVWSCARVGGWHDTHLCQWFHTIPLLAIRRGCKQCRFQTQLHQLTEKSALRGRKCIQHVCHALSGSWM